MSPQNMTSISRTTGLICLALFWLSSAIPASSEPTVFDKIDAAYQAGQIDQAAMLFEQARAFFSPQDVSGEFKSSTPGYVKSGTGLIMQIREAWDTFTPEQQAVLASYLARPTKQFQFDSPTGYFKIHYDTAGPEAVPPQDNNVNSIPDYVERLGDYCDSSRTHYLDNLGFLEPPLDPSQGDAYDIYLLAIQGYGATFPESPADSPWNDYTSYIAIHCRMDFNLYPNDDPEGDTIGAQKVTAAHEYFHAVQLGYQFDLDEYLWFMEATSTWMEEVVFPEVNDNYSYLNEFFFVPYVKLTSTQAYHEYGDFVWPGFLWERFDSSIIRLIWEACRYNACLVAHDSALAAYGTDLKHTFPEFVLWNYYTGSRAIPGQYYPEAAAYPQVTYDQTFPTLEQDLVIPVHAPDGLACNYIEFTVDTGAFGMLEIELDGVNTVRWAVAGIASGAGPDAVESEISSGTEVLYLRFPFIDDYERVTVIPTVISRYALSNSYTLTSRILPYGDANYDLTVNVSDAVYLVDYVFRGGPSPEPLMESGDANCDGSINVADAVTIVRFVFGGGPEPCAGR